MNPQLYSKLSSLRKSCYISLASAGALFAFSLDAFEEAIKRYKECSESIFVYLSLFIAISLATAFVFSILRFKKTNERIHTLELKLGAALITKKK